MVLIASPCQKAIRIANKRTRAQPPLPVTTTPRPVILLTFFTYSHRSTSSRSHFKTKKQTVAMRRRSAVSHQKHARRRCRPCALPRLRNPCDKSRRKAMTSYKYHNHDDPLCPSPPASPCMHGYIVRIGLGRRRRERAERPLLHGAVLHLQLVQRQRNLRLHVHVVSSGSRCIMKRVHIVLPLS